MTKIFIGGPLGHHNFREELGLVDRKVSELNPKIQINDSVFTYVGPIVPSCDHGCWHAILSTGGDAADDGSIDAKGYQIHLHLDNPSRIVAANFSQIDIADMCFFWFPDKTSYGSLVELGYAVGKGKPVYAGFSSVAFPFEISTEPHPENTEWEEYKESLPGHELWYAGMSAKQVYRTATVREAFIQAFIEFKHDRIDSTSIPEWRQMIVSDDQKSIERFGVQLPGLITFES
jgi:hypothetical protein